MVWRFSRSTWNLTFDVQYAEDIPIVADPLQSHWHFLRESFPFQTTDLWCRKTDWQYLTVVTWLTRQGLRSNVRKTATWETSILCWRTHLTTIVTSFPPLFPVSLHTWKQKHANTEDMLQGQMLVNAFRCGFWYGRLDNTWCPCLTGLSCSLALEAGPDVRQLRCSEVTRGSN